MVARQPFAGCIERRYVPGETSSKRYVPEASLVVVCDAPLASVSVAVHPESPSSSESRFPSRLRSLKTPLSSVPLQGCPYQKLRPQCNR
jgi:hypothetical protein